MMSVGITSNCVCVMSSSMLLYLSLLGFVLSEDCQFYLAPSLIPGASRGIFAGVNFSKGLVELSSTLIVDSDVIENTQVESIVLRIYS